MLLKDKVAVITGGAGQNGLGFATARMMAEQGARVVILDLAVADPQAAAARLGAQHLGLVADVTDKASCEAAAAQIKAAMGRIDILVNNAGITQPVKFLDITGQDYDRILDVSLRGTLYASQAVLPTMIALRQWGERYGGNVNSELVLVDARKGFVNAHRKIAVAQRDSNLQEINFGCVGPGPLSQPAGLRVVNG